jgi:hypothetical protein
VKVAVEMTLAALAGVLAALLAVALTDAGGAHPHLHAAALAFGIFGGLGLYGLLRR